MPSSCLVLFPTLAAPYIQSTTTQLCCCVGIPSMPLLIVTFPKIRKLKNYSCKYVLLQIASVLLHFLCQTLIKTWSTEWLFNRFRSLINQVLGNCRLFFIFFFLYLKSLAACFLTQPKINELDTLEAVLCFFSQVIYCFSWFFRSKYYCSHCLFLDLNKV